MLGLALFLVSRCVYVSLCFAWLVFEFVLVLMALDGYQMALDGFQMALDGSRMALDGSCLAPV